MAGDQTRRGYRGHTMKGMVLAMVANITGVANHLEIAKTRGPRYMQRPPWPQRRSYGITAG